MAADELTDDEYNARELASRWAIRIGEWRRRGVPIPPVEVDLPAGEVETFRARLAELIGADVFIQEGPGPVRVTFAVHFDR